MKGSKPGKHQITGIPFPSSDPRYHRIYDRMRNGDTLEEALADIDTYRGGGKKKKPEGSPPEKSTKKVLKKSSNSPSKNSGNGKVQAVDLLANDKVPDHVKDKIQKAQGLTLEPNTAAAKGKSAGTIKNHQHGFTMLELGTITIPVRLEIDNPGFPAAQSSPSPIPEDVFWFITNDLTTLNRNVKRLIDVMEKIENHLAVFAEKQEKK